MLKNIFRGIIATLMLLGTTVYAQDNTPSPQSNDGYKTLDGNWEYIKGLVDKHFEEAKNDGYKTLDDNWEHLKGLVKQTFWRSEKTWTSLN